MSDDQARPPEDIRPLVAIRPSNGGVWLFGTGLAVAGGLLFYALDSHRRSLDTPTTIASADDAGPMISSPPDLAVPDFSSPSLGGGLDTPYAEQTASLAPRFGAPVAERPTASSLVVTQRQPAPAVPPPSGWNQPWGDPTSPNLAPPGAPSAPSVVYDAPQAQRAAPANATEAEGQETARKGEERVKASRFANPSTTVPKGTVIQAVLETALDSTRAGFARAIISRDVFSFDGSRILVPKGSRLIGEYKADLAPGQKRALIQWQRLMRPDGIVINIDSPTADPLGRAGVKGDVNTHFFERFSGAILQSALDIGVQLATRRASRNSVIVALPGSTQGIVNNNPDKIQPTLKVKQGASVSVFVARDLDFTSVGS